jgi:hypothetical protein
MRSISIAAAILTSCGGIEARFGIRPEACFVARTRVDAIAALHGKLMIHMLQLLAPLIQF